MNEDIQKAIQTILADLDAKIRQEVRNWWNNVRSQKPESLPWFSNGLRGFLNKLYYNNTPENPDWKQYESTKISLLEYVSIKKDLTSVLMEGAPVDASNVIDSLISTLMPLIQGAINQISTIVSSNVDSSSTEPEKTPIAAPESKPSKEEIPVPPKEEPKPEREEIPTPPSEKEEPVTKVTSSEPDLKSNPTTDFDDEEIEPDEKETVFRTLTNYASSGDSLPLIKKLASIGIPVSKVRKKLIIDTKQSEQGKEEVAAALWELMDYLSTRPDNELSKIGLLKDDLIKVDMNYWRRFLKGSEDLFMGIKISKEIYEALADHIGKNAFSEQRKRYRRMLRENKKETRDIIMSRKLNINDKTSFFLESIKQR